MLRLRATEQIEDEAGEQEQADDGGEDEEGCFHRRWTRLAGAIWFVKTNGSERGVDAIERPTGARGDRAGVGAEGGEAREAKDGVGMMLLAGVGDVGGDEVEFAAELPHEARREHPPAAEQLRERRVIAAEVAGKNAERIARVAQISSGRGPAVAA